MTFCPFRRAIVACTLCVGVVVPVAAQSTGVPPTGVPPTGVTPREAGMEPSPHIHFARGLKLDGQLDEDVWNLADSVTSFTQRDPRQGAPASERTVVRFIGSPEGLWVGIWAFDREPESIRRTQLRRDADLGADDHVSVMLSPTADKRTAFLFSINPNGALNDAEVLNFEGESREWDGIWDGRARVTDAGWQAEMLIPWQTLRYRPIHADESADGWDINVRRYIRRKNESALWAAWKRTEGIRFLERAATLIGFREAIQVLENGLPRRAIAEVRPYAVTNGAVTERSVEEDGTLRAIKPAGVRGTVGLDAKLAPTPTLTLDLTVNSDFAQAEVDRQVVNLTRFSLFFPEQRPFFTEGAGIFDFGRRGQTQLFYSRRIGLGSGGSPIPLQAGARLTGRLGAQQLGLITTHTGGEDPATAVVGRVKRDVLGRGYIGAMGTLHAPQGEAQTAAGGLDVNLPYVVRDQNLVFIGAAAVDGSATSGDPVYARGMIDFPNDIADIALRFERVGEGFRPDLGFVQQRGVTRLSWQTELTPRPDALGAIGKPFAAMHVRQFKFSLLDGELVRTMGTTGPLVGLTNGSISTTPFGLEFDSGDELSIELTREYDAPRESFDVFDDVSIAPGRYAWDATELRFESSSARMIGVDLSYTRGRFYTGRSAEIDASLTGRFAPHVNIGVDYNRTAVSLPQGTGTRRFTAQTAQVRLDYAASPRLSTTVFAQWDNESRRGAVNARARWTSSPGSDLYLVWTSQWPTGLSRGIPWRTPTRGTMVAKYVKYFRV
jgi:hypothetical protein